MKNEQFRGPNCHLNRAIMRIRQACEALQQFRGEFSNEIVLERDSMYCENFKSLAAYEAADTVRHLLQHARRQVSQIKILNRRE